MTTVALFHFPSSLLKAARWSWEITSQLVGSGQTASGISPVTRIDGGGAWKASLSDINLRRSEHRRSWRSVSAICDGGVSPIVVPLQCSHDVPFPTVMGTLLTRYDDVMHTDDVPFASGVGYHVGVVDATLSLAAYIGATMLKVDISYGGDLQGGEHFSINHPVMRYRLYRLRTVKDNGDGTWNVTITPPLRGDVPAGMHLDFETPKVVMRLATGNAMDATFESPNVSRPTVNFIEAFPPFPVP